MTRCINMYVIMSHTVVRLCRMHKHGPSYDNTLLAVVLLDTTMIVYRARWGGVVGTTCRTGFQIESHLPEYSRKLKI
jgi:hypothetical protein